MYQFVNVNLLQPEMNNLSGSSVWSRSRTVLVKASASFPTLAAFVALLGILFHNAPVLADGCPAPSFDSVSIPAGAVSADVVVQPIDDTEVEGSETVVLTLSTNAAYTIGQGGSSATVTIADNDEVATDPTIHPGHLFVSESDSGNIYQVAPDGTRSTFATGMSNLWGLAFGPDGNLFAADYGAGTIYRFTPNGARSVFANVNLFNSVAHGLIFDSTGNLFVTPVPGAYIYKINPDGS
ncbi:MAG: hypothetical protein DME19_14490, partial [Verrucomicrobia bacterium]